MGRLIDADRLKAHYAWWGDDNDKRRTFDCIVDVQPTAGGWIPGKPYTANHVLVTRRWQEDDLEVCELDYAVDKQIPGFVDNVTAWMPLPEPYKEGE